MLSYYLVTTMLLFGILTTYFCMDGPKFSDKNGWLDEEAKKLEFPIGPSLFLMAFFVSLIPVFRWVMAVGFVESALIKRREDDS